jgi:serine/threonine protein kinase
VLHRDIKPSNLIWGEDDRIYLVDFGAVQDRATREGATFTVVGTYGYAPMEQFSGRAVPASDLYALGVTLIHLLTGTSPADLPQRNLRICFEEQVTLTPKVVNWLKTLTEPAPEQRFKSASQALSALESALTPSITKDNSTIERQILNNSGHGNILDSAVPVPHEIKGWNWGAFLMPWFWPFTNQVWIGLFSYVPNCQLIMALAMGAKGNEWAWKSRRWRSIEQFKAPSTTLGGCWYVFLGEYVSDRNIYVAPGFMKQNRASLYTKLMNSESVTYGISTIHAGLMIKQKDKDARIRCCKRNRLYRSAISSSNN